MPARWDEYWIVVLLASGFIQFALFAFVVRDKEYKDAKFAHIAGYTALAIYIVCLIPLAIFLLPAMLALAALMWGAAWLIDRIRPPSPTLLSRKAAPELMPLWPAPAPAPPPARGPPGPAPGGLPLFKILRTSLEAKSDAVIITVRFLLFNSMPTQIVLDDVHACLYERELVAPPPTLSLGYEGKLLLQSGNTVEKTEGRRYSFDPGDGGEYDLVLSLSRGGGGARFIFGLVLDWYAIGGSPAFQRQSIVSDCIFLLTYGSRIGLGIGQSKGEAKLVVVDESAINTLRLRWASHPRYLEYINQLETLLKEHRTRRLVPHA